MARIYGFRTGNVPAGAWGPNSPPQDMGLEVLSRIGLIAEGAALSQVDPSEYSPAGQRAPLACREISQGWGGGVFADSNNPTTTLNMDEDPDNWADRATAIHGSYPQRWRSLLYMRNRIKAGDILFLPNLPERRRGVFVQVIKRPDGSAPYRWAQTDLFDLNHRLAVTLPPPEHLLSFPYGHPVLHGLGLHSPQALSPIWDAGEVCCEEPLSPLVQYLSAAFNVCPNPTSTANYLNAPESGISSVLWTLRQGASHAVGAAIESLSPAEFELLIVCHLERLGFEIERRQWHDGQGGDIDILALLPADLVQCSRRVALQIKHSGDHTDKAYQQLQQGCSSWVTQFPGRSISEAAILSFSQSNTNQPLPENLSANGVEIPLLLRERQEIIEALLSNL